MTNFTLFSKLPKELRLIIFEFALPDTGPCILPLALYYNMPFPVHPEWIERREKRLQGTLGLETSYPIRHDHSIRLLSTCQESRLVYINQFCYNLPTGEERVIRFNGDCVVYIDNFAVLIYKLVEMNNAKQLPEQVARKLATLTRVGVGISLLQLEPRETVMVLAEFFPKLEILVVNTCKYPNQSYIADLLAEKALKSLYQEAESYKAKENREYKCLRVECISEMSLPIWNPMV